MTKAVGSEGGRGGRKGMGATSFAKSSPQPPVWPIIRNILRPRRHKNPDLGACANCNQFIIKHLYRKTTPRYFHLPEWALTDRIGSVY